MTEVKLKAHDSVGHAGAFSTCKIAAQVEQMH